MTFTDPFAHEAVGTPLNVPLHPTQIYLSANAFLIFLVLQWAYKRRTFDGEVFWLYVLLYSITRGIIEVWRGDLVRGFVIPGILSTSQFIGVLTALASLGMLSVASRSRRRDADCSVESQSSCHPERSEGSEGPFGRCRFFVARARMQAERS